MGDLDLLRKFQQIDKNNDKSKLGLLDNLKSRIETDVFLMDFQDKNTDAARAVEKRLEDDLYYVRTCISAYKLSGLSAESMRQINVINKRYKR